jgi:hypothetical protein
VTLEDLTAPATSLLLPSPTHPPAKVSNSIRIALEDASPPKTISELPLLLPKQPAFKVDDMPIAKASKAIRPSKHRHCSEDATVHPSAAVKDDGSLSPLAKRPRKNAYPRPDTDAQIRSRANVTPGMSKQAAYKRKVLEEIRNGTYNRDHKRWKTFKGKIMLIDPDADVPDDPARLLSVKHSCCGSWIRMSTPYNTEHFKKHVTTCSFSTATGGMKTLESYGIRALATNTQSHRSAPSLSSITLPCPGLTEREDPRIKQYVKHTSVTSAGGKNLFKVTKQLFKVKFNKLSSKGKDIVRQKQIQTHRWSVDRIRKCVHAIRAKSCTGVSQLAEDGTLLPCNQCLRLLSSRGFRNAIYRKLPKNENRVYVPHLFQPTEIGKMYGHGFNDLIDGVCPIHESIAFILCLLLIDLQS